MLINEDSEYVLGTESAESVKKLTGRRQDYNVLQELGISFAFAGPGILMYMTAMVFHLSGWMFLFGVLLLVVGWALSKPYGWGRPAARRSYLKKCIDENRVITSDDVLYRMLQMPLTHRRVDNPPGQPGQQSPYEKDVDDFIAVIAPYRNRENPELSEFLTWTWEREHGPVYELPSLVNIGVDMDDLEGLQYRIRTVILQLRQKRLAQLQQSQIELADAREKERAELAYLQSAILRKR